MVVAPADVQRIITLRVGDLDPATGDAPVQGGAGLVASNIPTLWALRADKAMVAPRLQELYVQRDALDMLIGQLRDRVDITQGDPQLAVRQNQRLLGAQAQRTETQTEILRLEQIAQANRSPAMGQITTTEPIAPPVPGSLPPTATPGVRDAGGPQYSGSPYWPMRRP